MSTPANLGNELHGVVNPEWLSLTLEAAIDPELPIVDAHHHLWRREGNSYLVPELVADMSAGHNVRATVHIQCYSMHSSDVPERMSPVGETEFANGAASEFAAGTFGAMRGCAGIVGYARLSEGASIRDVLEAHLRVAGARFKGIRNISSWHADPGIRSTRYPPPPGMLVDKAFREGFAQLAPLGLSFDAWMYHTQLNELVDLARAFPGTSIVLDHIGTPLGIGPYEGRADEIFVEWSKRMQSLAKCPNVSVKLSGMAMKVAGSRHSSEPRPPTSAMLCAQWGRYFLACIDSFGADRCMFASNFPVDKVACSYPVLWNAFKRIVADFSVSDRALLFSGNAARFYRLDAR